MTLEDIELYESYSWNLALAHAKTTVRVSDPEKDDTVMQVPHAGCAIDFATGYFEACNVMRKEAGIDIIEFADRETPKWISDLGL